MFCREKLKERVLHRADLICDISDRQLLELIEEELQQMSEEGYLPLKYKYELLKEVYNSLRRLDILQDLLDDTSITEIMINGYQNVFVEIAGKLRRCHKKFSSEEKLYQVIQQIVAGANRIVNETNPIVDARLAASLFEWCRYDDQKVCGGTYDDGMAAEKRGLYTFYGAVS